MSLAPRKARLSAVIPATATATDAVFVIGKAPFAGVISAVTFIAAALLTGANTNSRTLEVINKGTAGAGTVKPAAKAFTSGVNAAAFDETVITLSVTAANLVVAEGDVIAFNSDSIGTGLADPGGFVEVVIDRTS